jgi:hypothetical protein
MFALHAVWSPLGRLWLWAEDPEAERLAEHDGDAPVAHPFCGGVDRIGEWLTENGLQAEQDSFALLLASTSVGPSSSAALRVDAAAPPSDRLLPWSIEGWMVEAADLYFFLQLVDAGVPEDFVIADDLRALCTIGRWAESLVDRGQVRPGLAPVDGAWTATWSPRVAEPDDAACRQALIEGLPPVLRACGALRVGEGAWDGAQVMARDEVVDAVAWAVVDAIARSRTEGAVAALPKGRKAKVSAGAAWLAALTAFDGALDPRVKDAELLDAALSGWGHPPQVDAGGAHTARLHEPAPPPLHVDEPAPGQLVDAGEAHALLLHDAEPTLPWVDDPAPVDAGDEVTSPVPQVGEVEQPEPNATEPVRAAQTSGEPALGDALRGFWSGVTPEVPQGEPPAPWEAGPLVVDGVDLSGAALALVAQAAAGEG